MRITSACVVLAIALTASAATTKNDDSCDIAVLPAATLLLPYFEVALQEPHTTLFTVTNVGSQPQVARVTLLTDYAYPVISFDLMLTGYDVQSVNLSDVLVRGVIARGDGRAGRLSDADNPLLDESSCAQLPAQLPSALLTRMQQAFTTGKVPGCNTVGGVHDRMIGYATIDVVGACTSSMPTDEAYFASDIRFDNILIGDYQQIDAAGSFAQGNAMVHIRAVPEGGTRQTRFGPDYLVDFERTFYSRYQRGDTRDARQPLPSLFAARWIDGGPASFRTRLKIWREGNTTSTTACSAYPSAGGALGITEVVRFDENENPEVHVPGGHIPGPITNAPVLASTSSVSPMQEIVFPPNATGAVAGWLYLNLDVSDATGHPPASQNWVIVSMWSQGYAVDFEAPALGNGCTPETDQSEAVGGTRPIGPPSP
jgi:hypothetical protein